MLYQFTTIDGRDALINMDCIQSIYPEWEDQSRYEYHSITSDIEKAASTDNYVINLTDGSRFTITLEAYKNFKELLVTADSVVLDSTQTRKDSDTEKED